ncbi:hypothetical protein N0V93_004478 [Gnomoniopsis smithogilvyi]|uniref:Uncharacterized protein n=1 Tax=Gnomoniopsis smithogilvyi TaxID=1191159 RepID=A0A9W8YRK1_9PEZI|nr:hypothetical protein N0V93_004478 [Gnomoniopsis smithogilvyi]
MFLKKKILKTLLRVKLTSPVAGPVVNDQPSEPPITLGEYVSPWVDCQYGPPDDRQTGESRMILTVRPDPVDLEITGTARLHYEAKLYLRDKNALPPLPVVEVGEVQSYRLSKATEMIPRSPRTIQTMPWVQQFLQPDDGLPQDGTLMDMAFLLQALYSPNGMAAAAPTLSQAFHARDCLQNDSLVYIKLVYIQPTFQGQRLGRTLFDSFYHCLRRLPEFYACGDKTTLILQPGHPGGAQGAGYAGMTRAAVIAQLIPIYQALGFTVYRSRQYLDPDTNLPDGDPVTAMGRQLPLE